MSKSVPPFLPELVPPNATADKPVGCWPLIWGRQSTLSYVIDLDLLFNEPLSALYSDHKKDLRNHGDSLHHPKHDYTELALDVEYFIHQHSLQDPILIGHSMGMRHIQSQAAPVSSLSEADALLSQFEPDPAIRLFLLTNLTRKSGKDHLHFRVPLDILSSSLDALGDFPYTDPRKTRFEKPALIVRATRSHYLPDHSKELMQTFFPNLKMVDFDCGHWVITEKPHEFRQKLQELDTNERGGPFSAAVDFLRDTVLSTS
ncbi:alpha/beta hydrolase, putative [Trichophyton verrucosum HKI 0517]|uniref:Alpha/beta hydrolase, putative n=1 Tax=Trichophyton verrucosum (strain HKI 0517) TaxID=663202 RepID=D4D9Y8_TRIVH|nr:alpha/beta hydrolase, putative [Trichophyton verrucosum HKI 0517]EFE41327.1 alpha/beta hydrolase, putative [Trichophyton verrucosum HKI 0517]